jgi:multidrug resistance efflux pump
MFTGQASFDGGVAERDQAGRSVRFLDQALWRRLSEATSREDYLSAWLALQCSMLDGVVRAVLVLRNVDDDQLTASTYWPEATQVPTELVETIEEAVAKCQGVARAGASGETAGASFAALPLLDRQEVWGAIGVELGALTRQDLSLVMRRLQWGGAWVDALLWRDRMERTVQDNERVQAAIDVIATALDEPSFRASCASLSAELAARLECDRVSIGFVGRNRVKVVALSHSAHFDRRMKVMADLGRAMEEAIDQGQAIAFPAPEGQIAAARAHAELIRQGHAAHVLTIPLTDAGAPVGAIALERASDVAFDDRTIELCTAIAVAVGPILNAKRRDDRLLITKGFESLVRAAHVVLGPGYLGRKLLVLLVAALGVYLAVAEGQFRITADARIEGSIERQIVAPFDGYIATVHARPGDRVTTGTVLATLDDRDFALERVRWIAERQQRQLEYEQALAESKRPALNLIRTQMDRADVEIALREEQLRRARLVAPFDAYVAKGDLDQAIGSSVQRGQTLFELTPLDDYRIVLFVDERDIAHIAMGQEGALVASAVPERAIPFVVERMTSVSEPGDGQNRFRVEAVLRDRTDIDRLRPGMSGIGKIAVDERRLLWIWSYKIVDWVRLRVWRWWK